MNCDEKNQVFVTAAYTNHCVVYIMRYMLAKQNKTKQKKKIRYQSFHSYFAFIQTRIKIGKMKRN